MYRTCRFPLVLLCCFLALATPLAAQTIAAPSSGTENALVLENARLRLVVNLNKGTLTGEHFEAIVPKVVGSTPPVLETDGGFGVEVTFTDWQAPGFPNNAENPIILGGSMFRFLRADRIRRTDGGESLTLFFSGIEHPILLRMTYTLDNDATTLHRSLAVRDTTFGHHFLRAFWPRLGDVKPVQSIEHKGGFGQPIALELKSGNAFVGTEYPAADNLVTGFQEGKTCAVKCGHEVGKLLGAEWTESESVVLELHAGTLVKQAFFSYLDRIRVAPLRPYALYNTWYDLRSPDYPRVPLANIMSEQSALRMVKLLREKMIDRHGITLDAFVLDDGWDIYKSDWVLRKEQWPNGLKPLALELAKTNTDLGLWFGPTGGYSFRNYRLNWMRANGYETVGDQMCVGGAKYSALLKQRTTDFVSKDGVGYFKWDGIQFSCSEPGHGHPTDIYSRHAVMESVIGMTRAVREKNPKAFLNITSGTWMSPWWVKYANTIWMQGEDYGYADVPSISLRDGAMTYRDFVLYEDLKLKGLWFPVANLMTHGIIKGKLEMLGSPIEPLDKFTNDVLLYFARGVSMYELYISPDIIADGEWTAIAQSMRWARDRFPLLMHTEMIGGNPLKREAYGYAHVDGRRGIFALRNPFIEPSALDIALTPELGFDPNAEQLVLERVYPTRWISPVVYRAGETVKVPLDGYEMAVYEMYPVREAKEPLYAGASFSVDERGGGRREYTFFGASGDGRLLNADRIGDGRKLEAEYLRIFSDLREEKIPEPVATPTVKERRDLANTFELSGVFHTANRSQEIAVLIAPDASAPDNVAFTLLATVDGRETEVRFEKQEGRSQWYHLSLIPGRHTCALTLRKTQGAWSGAVRTQIWSVGRIIMPLKKLDVTIDPASASRVLPPSVFPAAETVRNVKLGEVMLEVQ